MGEAGLNEDNIEPDRSGVIWGSGIGGFETIEGEIEDVTKRGGIAKYSPFLIPKMIADIAAGMLSIRYNFRGPNYATVSACASSTHAIACAFDYIRFNRADVMICGGSEASVTRAGIGGFSSMKALSERNDSPTTASRPFDMNRDGFVLGEGAGCLILEEYEHAKKRGANVLAEIVGVGMTADAYHMTAPHPEGLGAAQVMKLAVQDAGLNMEDVDYINVHGTSTPLGDIAETKAILKVFGDHAYKANISSTKSMTGHLLGAAGAVETIACIAAVQRNVVPPTINHETIDPAFDPKLNLTLNEPQERTVKIALSNTFGFGGHNASVVVKAI
jgi:3-oxoacyl-[acyl-carrier-protein] synthase II